MRTAGHYCPKQSLYGMEPPAVESRVSYFVDKKSLFSTKLKHRSGNIGIWNLSLSKRKISVFEKITVVKALIISECFRKLRLSFVSLKIELIKIELVSFINTQLLRYYNILAVQHQPFDNHMTLVSQAALDIGLPKVNISCREQVFLSKKVVTFNHGQNVWDKL